MRDRLTKVESALIKLATDVGEIRREQASMRLEMAGLRNEVRTSIGGLEASIQEIAVTTRGLTNAVLQLMHNHPGVNALEARVAALERDRGH